jgi:F-type H+-transporting ATPase subunit delta
MSMNKKQVMRAARQLLSLCLVNGELDKDRVRNLVTEIIQSRHGGYLTLLAQFLRLLRIDLARHTAVIESAEPIPEDLRGDIESHLEHTYGRGLSKQFLLNPGLIGGMRVRVGSDVFDRSVQSGIAELRKAFGIVAADGRRAPVG